MFCKMRACKESNENAWRYFRIFQAIPREIKFFFWVKFFGEYKPEPWVNKMIRWREERESCEGIFWMCCGFIALTSWADIYVIYLNNLCSKSTYLQKSINNEKYVEFMGYFVSPFFSLFSISHQFQVPQQRTDIIFQP